MNIAKNLMLKRLLLSTIIIAILTLGNANAKMFLGLEVSGDMGQMLSANSNNVYKKGSSAFDNIDKVAVYAGFHLGTQHFANDYIGIRWLLGVGYSDVF